MYFLLGCFYYDIKEVVRIVECFFINEYNEGLKLRMVEFMRFSSVVF